MDQKRDTLGDQYGRNLAAASYPKVDEVPGAADAFRRKWVLRLSVEAPSDDALRSAASSFEVRAKQEIRKSLGLQHNADLRYPSVLAVQLGAHHLVLEIDCPSALAGMGDAAAIATWVILRHADDLWRLEDIQGIPKSYWFGMS